MLLGQLLVTWEIHFGFPGVWKPSSCGHVTLASRAGGVLSDAAGPGVQSCLRNTGISEKDLVNNGG